MPSSWVGKIRQAATTGQGEFPTNPKKFTASNGCNSDICVTRNGLPLSNEEGDHDEKEKSDHQQRLQNLNRNAASMQDISPHAQSPIN